TAPSTTEPHTLSLHDALPICPAPRPEGDGIADQPPPEALLAHPPAGQPPLHHGVHLQPGRVVAAPTVGLAGKQGGEIDQHGHRWVDPPERRLYRLTVVADRLQRTHAFDHTFE